MPKLSEGQLEPLFRRLNLAHTRRIYQDVADRAEKENWSYRDFLTLLLAEEVAHRKQTRLQRFTRKAHFPFFKTIDEFDFSLQTTLRQSLLGSYLGPDFVTEGRSLIVYGKAGRGKTHLAVAIGYRAIQNGFETLCTTAAELVEKLSNASKKGRLQESLLTYTHPHVLVIDEVGYLTYGPDAANVLFHVVNDRHLRKRPMIFTTNKPLSEWGKVLHDEDLAAAILDRILERGRLIHLDGPSGRTRHLNLEGVLPGAAERARISGIRVPEFPEPTACDVRERTGCERHCRDTPNDVRQINFHIAKGQRVVSNGRHRRSVLPPTIKVSIEEEASEADESPILAPTAAPLPAGQSRLQRQWPLQSLLHFHRNLGHTRLC
jgi:DNA replication protein DnaC